MLVEYTTLHVTCPALCSCAMTNDIYYFRSSTVETLPDSILMLISTESELN